VGSNPTATAKPTHPPRWLPDDSSSRGYLPKRDVQATDNPRLEPVSAPSSERRPRVVPMMPMAVILVSVVVVVALGAALHMSQTASQRQLTTRFEARGQLASEFTATRVDQLLDQESSAAVDLLSGTTRLDEALASAADVFDFRGAAILSSQGIAMATYPSTPGLIGTAMAPQYPFLTAALNGKPAVSSVIVSASRGVPVVEFAAPYYTPNGRRVFSGAYELNRTPLDAFLKTVTAIPGSRVFLVDGDDIVVATNADGNDGPRTMPSDLAGAHTRAANGNYDSSAGEPSYFTSQPVEGTPWTLVLAIPQGALFAPLRGPQHTVPWIVLGLVALLTAGANWMLLRLLSGRDALRVLNAALDESARTDQLTKLPNRRHLDESLTAALSAGGRHQLPVSVLVMDLDHFKKVNDTYGHTAGDRVLEHVAGILEQAVRTEDIVGRWGGEEFLAVLPHTEGPGAALIAERLCQIVRDTPYVNSAGDRTIVTTLSIGCATDLIGGDKDRLIHRADQALYRAKTEGRDSVRSEVSPRDKHGEALHHA
jgi:diguanylate cyclase (GGDEF)-like protein